MAKAVDLWLTTVDLRLSAVEKFTSYPGSIHWTHES